MWKKKYQYMLKNLPSEADFVYSHTKNPAANVNGNYILTDKNWRF